MVALLIVVLIGAIILNRYHEAKDSSKLLGTISLDNGDEKIDWGRYPTTDIALSESYTISRPGAYHFTGKISDGLISIKVSKDEPVKIILDHVSIKNTKGPAIHCAEADDLVIELIGENTLEDAENYDTTYDADTKGVVSSKSDTTFMGDGSLTIISHKEDGIIAKDDLKFISGTYYISAADDAIRGKDSVYIKNGHFNLTAGADTIKSTNQYDAGKGFVVIENGEFNLEAGAKGIKAISSILIYDGKYQLQTYDDAIHTDNYIGISGGEFEIHSGDDGIHANKELIIDGGKISILKAYEGLEAQVVTINGGDISILALDDGINAGGGADSSATNRKGAGAFDADLSCKLTINGGKLYVNSAGDGIDSNGYLYFNGGNVVVDGPTNNGNGALDSGSGITMTGGKVVAVGTSSMAVNLGQKSTIYNISVYFSDLLAKNTVIEVKNPAGDNIISHTSAKTFSHLAAGSDQFILGETYSIYLNGEKYQAFTISGIVTTIGDTGTSPQQGPPPARP